ncbi:glycosyltransferase family 39 protein [Candidatus Uhrbacteria bacterium]|nr:glycosyltransferase family 39 protein [Candidatus Uhrbacteria bacterium]
MKRYRKIIIGFLCAAAVVLIFLAYSLLSFASIDGGTVRLNSPDETANYFFVRSIAQTGQIGYDEPLLAISKGVVHPRSMTTAGDKVVPVGFLGLAVVYGFLAKIFGTWAILFFTPLLAVCSAFAFYALLRRIFPRSVAALSAVLMLVHPAYWYYAARGMLPNILFVDLLIIGALCVACAFEKKRWWLSLLGGLLIGSALTVRFSEILWVSAAAIVFIIAGLRRRTVAGILLGILGCAIPLGIFFSLNKAVYGHPLLFGYQMTATYESVSALDRTLDILRHFSMSALPALKESVVETLEKARSYAFPFGFDPPTFSVHFYQYGIGMFWWFSLLTVFGFFIVLRKALYDCFRRHRYRPMGYIALALFVGSWLTAFYGSWIFFDNIAEEVTIGNSYVRYWLPMYLLSLPFAASTLVFFLRGAAGRVPRTLIVIAIVAVLMFFSGKAVLYEYRDSVFPVAENITRYHKNAEWISTMTPSDAVIFSERSDKNFFPQRRVAQSFPNLAERDLVPPLVARVPVYYYSLWTVADADYVSTRYFAEYGLRLSLVASFGEGERLYKVIATE